MVPIVFGVIHDAILAQPYLSHPGLKSPSHPLAVVTDGASGLGQLGLAG
jgi:hypothetical protein